MEQFFLSPKVPLRDFIVLLLSSKLLQMFSAIAVNTLIIFLHAISIEHLEITVQVMISCCAKCRHECV